MNDNTRKLMLVYTAVGIFGLTGCGHKMDKPKTSSESAEFFKEIGTAEQENAEQSTNMDMQNAVVPPNASSDASADSIFTAGKPSIQDIQQALKNANIYLGKIDGVLGPKTKKAIEAFQTQNNLKSDGKVGPKTWQKLKAYLNTAAVEKNPVAPGAETTPRDSSSKAIND